MIKEGVGWNQFLVGANANYLMDVLGSRGLKLIWPSRGVVIWFHDDRVYQIVIFRPQATNLNRS